MWYAVDSLISYKVAFFNCLSNLLGRNHYKAVVQPAHDLVSCSQTTFFFCVGVGKGSGTLMLRILCSTPLQSGWILIAADWWSPQLFTLVNDQRCWIVILYATTGLDHVHRCLDCGRTTFRDMRVSWAVQMTTIPVVVFVAYHLRVLQERSESCCVTTILVEIFQWSFALKPSTFTRFICGNSWFLWIPVSFCASLLLKLRHILNFMKTWEVVAIVSHLTRITDVLGGAQNSNRLLNDPRESVRTTSNHSQRNREEYEAAPNLWKYTLYKIHFQYDQLTVTSGLLLFGTKLRDGVAGAASVSSCKQLATCHPYSFPSIAGIVDYATYVWKFDIHTPTR